MIILPIWIIPNKALSLSIYVCIYIYYIRIILSSIRISYHAHIKYKTTSISRPNINIMSQSYTNTRVNINWIKEPASERNEGRERETGSLHPLCHLFRGNQKGKAAGTCIKKEGVEMQILSTQKGNAAGTCSFFIGLVQLTTTDSS
jgi:hypothetical protein